MTLDRINHRPRTLRALLLWLQSQYALEAPTRLHDRDVADDGAPDHTEEAKRYLAMDQPRLLGDARWSQPDDWRRNACRLDPDGYHATPMRCAIERIREPERRALLRDLACNVLTPLDVTRDHDIPDVFAGDVMYRSLQTLWSTYAVMPVPQRSWVDKSESQRAAEEAA